MLRPKGHVGSSPTLGTKSPMKKIILASKNPVKIDAALRGFQSMFPGESFETEGFGVPSGVSEQPMTDAETFTGARNRAENARRERPGADFYVGIEGGIELKGDEMEAFAWVAVINESGVLGKGRTATFFLPPPVAALIAQGKELGEADDIVFGRTNSKQEEGAVGLLTESAITRTSYYVEAVTLALVSFKNPTLYGATIKATEHAIAQ